MTERRGDPTDLQLAIARLLTIGTYASVALLTAGVIALIAAGRSPLDEAPGLDPGRLPADLLALRPEGFLWLGLLLVVATPAARVVATLVSYVRRGERTMAWVSIGILAVIALGIAFALVAEA
jgi:uncharacterized membrane protein